MHLPPFPGFRPEAFAFLRDLKEHNERDWFKPRKETYDDELLWPTRCLVGSLADEARRRGLPITADPDRAVFRIYRDTRFSKDKRPYKTHVGAWLTRSGAKDEPGGVYVHVEPGACFVAAGYWQPETKLLGRFRARIAGEPDAFLRLAASLEGAGLTFETDEGLKRLPRGYEAHAESPVAAYLRWKSYLATRKISDAALATPAFVDEALAFVEAARPLLDFGHATERAG